MATVTEHGALTNFLGASSEEEGNDEEPTSTNTSEHEEEVQNPSGGEASSADSGSEEELEEDDGFGDEDDELEGDSDSVSESGSEAEEADKSGVLAGKQASIAKAFSKILSKQAPSSSKSDGKVAAAAAPILQGSTSVAKRKAEEEAEGARSKAAWKLLQEMRKRGHVIPKRRGEDPEADAREKVLQRSATRGVVRLFNAISGAQRKRRDAEAGGAGASQAARLGRASLLADLRSPAASGADAHLVPSTRGPTGLVPGAPRAQQHGSDDSGSEDGGEDQAGQGWEVLQRSFTGVQGGGKMKDWDKAQAVEEAGPANDSSDSE